ncbi:MAG: class I SAM-dependent methyltransferase [Spirochaetales bacterium]|nr:class I SAM-dependent methyltransferase [Spirochaetales bacterium]
MTDLTRKWEESGYNKQYLEISDIILQDRDRLMNILISHIRHFGKSRAGNTFLDLGCGDGVLAKHIHSFFPENTFHVCDGSEKMITAAKENLKHIAGCHFYTVTFEEIMENEVFGTRFDFIVSSFAVHHIQHEIKYRFFETLNSLLKPDGHFINIDTCLSGNQQTNEWYYTLWKEWIIGQQERAGIKEDYSDIPQKAPHKPENHYQELDIQLDWLKKAGFTNVDCYYKYGIFCIYGGQKTE